MNALGKARKPFLFVIDYQKKNPMILPLSEAGGNNICYAIEGVTNSDKLTTPAPKNIVFNKIPLTFEQYRQAFDVVMKNLRHGNSFLTNLTATTPIKTNLSLREIFEHSQAKYRLLFDDQFVVFSPEIFVRTTGNQISSFPMKGTIDASIPDAETILLNDPKETAEHNTIVDLIRNDLSMVAKEVYVKRFRYIDHLKTNNKELLQVSSEITGTLPDDFRDKLGDIIDQLLPAGSISGAPKPKTCAIIEEAENYDRGFYTGVFGIFDGDSINSGVMIRFIEKRDQELIFKSGGGITIFSEAEKEYQEIIDKVYVPIH